MTWATDRRLDYIDLLLIGAEDGEAVADPHFNLWGGTDEQAAANARLIAAATDLLAACEEIVREHENLDDRAPVEAYCGTCNLGTGPHKRLCAYHAAKRAIAKVLDDRSEPQQPPPKP